MTPINSQLKEPQLKQDVVGRVEEWSGTCWTKCSRPWLTSYWVKDATASGLSPRVRYPLLGLRITL